MPAVAGIVAITAGLALNSAFLVDLARAAALLSAAGLVSYLVVLAVASLTTARRAGWSLLPFLPATFACYHVSYGVGFLQGLLDFGLRRRRAPRVSMSQLTR